MSLKTKVGFLKRVRASRETLMGFVFILKKGVCGPLLNGMGFLILFPNGVGLYFI